jgi:hypothetical protein
LELIERNVRSDVVKYLNVAYNYLVRFFCLYVGGGEGAWMKDFVKIVRRLIGVYLKTLGSLVTSTQEYVY